jgi:branched-chain amino acid transport system substrate-binding protein
LSTVLSVQEINNKNGWLDCHPLVKGNAMKNKKTKKIESSDVTRRDFLKVAGTGVLAAGATSVVGFPTILRAAPPDIKIACVYPLSGAFSRNGNLTLQGAKAAMGWVNDNGGIKSLGGAKLVPVVGDCASTVEGAASAMDRLCRDPEIVMAMGAWASSFTMSSTEVTERLGIPQFSVSFADSLTNRGFKWGFYPNAPYSTLTQIVCPQVIELAKNAGKTIKTVMIVGNNQAASTSFYAACKENFNPLGIKFIAEETWAIGTLTDATPVIQKVKRLNPDLVVYMGDALTEIQMVMMKKKEFGVRVPFFCGGGWLGDPSLKFAGEYLESWIALTPCFPHKLTPPEWIERSLAQCRKEYSNEAWVGQELSFAWPLVPIMAEVLERAGTRDRNKIRDVAANMDIHNVMATRQVIGQGMAFDGTGRIAPKYRGAIIIQWQGGKPVVVFPPQLAQAKALWR